MSVFVKNKSGITLHQKETGLTNDWLNGTVLDAEEHRLCHELFDMRRLINLISSSNVCVVDDAVGTTEYSTSRSLEYFEAISHGEIVDEFASHEDEHQSVEEKGQSNGYAGLDVNGKVPTEQLPSSLGGVVYDGLWNANTNTPTIISGTGTTGHMYKVGTAGTTTIDSESSWSVGDQIIFNGATWDKIDNSESVSSVHGRTGNVAGQAGDYDAADVGLGNVDNTSDVDKPVSIDQLTALNLKEDKANKGAALGYAGLDANGKIPSANVQNNLDDVMENGSSADISTPIVIQTASTMNIQAAGSYSVGSSSMSEVIAGSKASTSYIAVNTSTFPNGVQITQDSTLKVSSSPATYDNQLEDESFVTKKWIEDAIADATASSGIGGKVGDIVASALTATQMYTQFTTDWLLCDGTQCTGSAYATLTGNNFTPDLRGRFLRALDTDGTVDPDGATRTLLDIQDDEFASHNHTQQQFGTGSLGAQNGTGTTARDGTLWNFRATDNTGGDETRPKNAAVNYFIKVN